MAEVTITIPDQYVTRVVDALCAMGGYDEAGGLTKQQFAKQMIQTLVKVRVLAYERQQIIDSATPTPLDM